MRSILVANPKGGAGKSTLATNLAGYFANQGKLVWITNVGCQIALAIFRNRINE